MRQVITQPPQRCRTYASLPSSVIFCVRISEASPDATHLPVGHSIVEPIVRHTSKTSSINTDHVELDIRRCAFHAVACRVKYELPIIWRPSGMPILLTSRSGMIGSSTGINFCRKCGALLTPTP